MSTADERFHRESRRGERRETSERANGAEFPVDFREVKSPYQAIKGRES